MLPSLDEAIETIKAGDKVTGRRMLADIIQADLDNEQAWLWLSGVVDSEAERRKCLKRVLEINPDNRAAKRGLARLEAQQTEAQEQSEAGSDSAQAEPPTTLSSRLDLLQEQQTGPGAAIPLEPVASEPKPPPKPESIDTSPISKSAAAGAVDEEALYEESDQAIGEEQSESRAAEEIGDGALDGDESDLDALAEQTPEEAVPEDAGGLMSRLVAFWHTDRGSLILGGGSVSLLLLCAACVIFGLVIRPIADELPATVAAAVGTSTHTPTATPTPTNTLTPSPTPTVTLTPSATPSATPTATGTSVVASTSTVTATPTRTATADRNLQNARVLRVVSGDMIEVLVDGVVQPVKYILIDAPAVDDPERGTEPLGQSSLEANRRLVEGQNVELEKDEVDTDELGRLWRYVYIDGLMVNEELLRQGLARVELIPPNLKHGARLQAIEREAQSSRIGIWSGQ